MWPFRKKKNPVPSKNNSLDQKIPDFLPKILEQESSEATKHLSDPFYTDILTNHNIGEDEKVAVYYSEDAYRKAVTDHSDEKEILICFLEELALQKRKYKELYYDQEGYGIGTFNDIELRVRQIATEKGIDLSNTGEPVLAFRIYPESKGTKYVAKDLNTEQDVEQLFDYCQILEASISKVGWEYLINHFGYEVLFKINNKSGWIDCVDIDEYKSEISVKINDAAENI